MLSRVPLAALGVLLQTLVIAGSLPVGSEIAVPALLAMLEDEGVHVAFSAKRPLLAIGKMKMEAFTLDFLSNMIETTLFHSLEDFDRIRHRKVFASMMSSPMSTAAYLVNVSS